MLKDLFAAINVIAAMAAITGAVMLNSTFMAAAGLTAAVAAVAWGLLAALDAILPAPDAELDDQGDGSCPICGHLAGTPHACIATLDDTELPYQPVKDGRLLPTWDTDTMGAPE